MKMEGTSCKSFALEILREEMHRPYLPVPEAGEKVKTEMKARFENSDSGMEDESSSPYSAVTPESKISPDSDTDMVSGNSLSPQSLNHSEGSAFSKIPKTFITGSECLYPSMAPISMLYPSNALAYFPNIPMSPWIPRDSFPKTSATTTPHPCALPHTMIKEPERQSAEQEVYGDVRDDKVYYHVDPRIPFTNYFMNLTRLFQKDSTSATVSSKTENSYEMKRDEDETKRMKVEETEPESDIDEETCGKSHSPCSTCTAPECSKEKTDFKATTHVSNPCSSTHTSSAYINDKFSSLPQHPFPTKLPQMERFPPQMASFPPNASMMHFMGGIPAPGAMFHPAFLQMSGLGPKRLNQEKPPPVKKYKCDVCGKAFSRSNTLVTHKRIHTGDKPFKCEVCGRAFRQPGNLTRHRLTHTTIKPYVCPTCNKAFNRASNLHTHMRTHTNYRPFICPYCGKGFHQKIDMKIHCYTHTGERPHRCNICGKGFTLASTLNTHRRLHCDPRYA